MIRTFTLTIFLVLYAFAAIFGQAPVITSYTPASGPVGSIVTLTGDHFNNLKEKNIIFFGPVRAEILTASTTQLTVKVPVSTNFSAPQVLNTDTHLTGKAAVAFRPTYTSKNAITAADFDPHFDVHLGDFPGSIAADDLNMDGKPDVLVNNSQQNTISIFENKSVPGPINAASFGSSIALATGVTPSWIATGDLDGDGKPDIVVTNSYTGTISVFKNLSNGGPLSAASFAAKIDFVVGAYPTFVTISDINNDGKPEIIVINNIDESLSIFQNDTQPGVINSASFLPKERLKTEPNPMVVRAEDLNSDEKKELVIASDYVIAIYQDNRTDNRIRAAAFELKTKLQTIARSVDIADLDGDSKPELVVQINNGRVLIYRNNTSVGYLDGNYDNNTSFPAPITLDPGSPSANTATVADMDGDGRPDIVSFIGGGQPQVSILRNISSGTPTASSFVRAVKLPMPSSGNGTTTDLPVVDFDGDGKPDIFAVTGGDKSFSIIRNNPQPPPVITSFTPASAQKDQVIVITGEHFAGTTSVTFGGVNAKSFVINSDQQIAAILGEGATGTVSITALSGQASKAGFVYSIPPPHITYATPQVYKTNLAIDPLAPTNTGGAVSGPGYGVVSTYAGVQPGGLVNGDLQSASFNRPVDLAADASGNIFIADRENNMIRKITPAGQVSTFAGTGEAGHQDGPGINAKFFGPYGISIDASSNLYVSDNGSGYIRKITPDGMVSTFAGSGILGYADGNAADARFSFITHSVFDADGNLFVADGASLIRKIRPDGNVSTLISNRNGLLSLESIAMDAGGNFFVADAQGNRIKKVTPAGVVSEYANVAGYYASGDGPVATATFKIPSGMIFDNLGNMYFGESDGAKIRKISPSGTVTTVAGNGTQGLVDGKSSEASFYRPRGLLLDNKGNLLVADEFNNAIRSVSLTGYSIDQALPPGLLFDTRSGIISGTPTAASPATNYTITAYNMGGSSTAVVNIKINELTPVLISPPDISYQTPQTYTVLTAIDPLLPVNTGGIIPPGDYNQVSTFAGGRAPVSYDGTGPDAGFNFPSGIGKDQAGNLYVSDYASGAIRRISTGAVVKTIATEGAPAGLAVNSDGDIFISDFNTNAIFRIKPNGSKSRFAGIGTAGMSDNNTGTLAKFNSPGGLAIDAADNIYVADQLNNAIRMISPSGRVTTIAGTGQAGKQDGPALSATFYNPDGIAVDKYGDIFVADTKNNLIRKISTDGSVTTFAGTGTAGSSDGDRLSATFNYPTGLVFDQLGNLLVADYKNNAIRKISTDGKVTRLAGTLSSGNTNGDALSATFNGPVFLVFDSQGNLFVTDFINTLIRKIALTGYTIDKPLSPGLVFDPKTGKISGTPTMLSPLTAYTITAYNAGGSKSTIINLEVIPNLTFDPIPDKTSCAVDFDPGAISNSIITYTSSNTAVAAIINNKVHVIQAGTTMITATITGGQSLQRPLTVTVVPQPAIQISASLPAPLCTGAPGITFTAIPVNAGTGSAYQWKLNGTDVGTNSITYKNDALQNGDQVTCTLTNYGVCPEPLSATSDTYTLSGLQSAPDPLPSITISVSTDNVHAGEPIIFTALLSDPTATGNYQWKVNGTNVGTNSNTYQNNNLHNSDQVTCSITLNNNCALPILSEISTVHILPAITIRIPNTFTPNGDGTNDTWALPDLNSFPSCLVQVFDRSGHQLMQSKDYSHNWDGKYNGKELPAGVYYYLIDLKNGQPKISGSITILR
jgi:gliding motility-associated-like protein